jgi:hypothetical protein
MDTMKESTHAGQDAINSRFIVKWIIAAVIICAGVGGGIYAGFALSNEGYGLPSEQALKNTTYLEIGQQFPDYELKDQISGMKLKVSTLNERGSLLFAFVSSHCGACEAMNKYWEKRIVQHLDKDIHLIWVYDAFEEENKGFDSTALAAARVMTTDRAKQIGTDGITATPTFVGITSDRNIALVVNGFDKNIDADYFNDRL